MITALKDIESAQIYLEQGTYKLAAESVGWAIAQLESAKAKLTPPNER